MSFSRRVRSVIALSFLLASCVFVACFEGPKDCGKNVARVVSISYEGPSTVPSSGDVRGYAVTITIERTNQSEDAIACFAVRDEDPWYKFFWAVDDVLAAGFILFRVGQDTVTMEGHFALFSKDGDNICGGGNPSSSDGCSGEDEAEVYLQTVDASGPTSPESATRTIRVE